MKKTLLSLAFLSAGLAFVPAAFAQNAQPASGNYQSSQPIGSGNWLIDLSVGRTDGYSKNSDFGSGFGSGSGSLFNNKNGRRTGYSALAGYRWKVGPDLGLGLEAGYADLGNYKLSNLGKSGSVNQTSTQNALHGWVLGGNGRINLLPGWYIGAHAGYFHANNNGGAYNDTVNQALFHGGNSGGYYAGIGTGWDINEHFGVGVKYDYFHASAGNVHDVPTNTDFSVRRSTGIVSLTGEYRY
ncbi:MAG: porin family protein [Rhodanobacter sp.]